MTFCVPNIIINLWNTESEVNKLSQRTGRPKSENPKNIDLKVRIDETTNRQLVDYCKTHNITRTEAIRMGIHLILSTK